MRYTFHIREVALARMNTKLNSADKLLILILLCFNYPRKYCDSYGEIKSLDLIACPIFPPRKRFIHKFP